MNPVRWSQIWQTEPVSCSNDCATIQSYTIPLLERSYGNIPSCSWPSHSIGSGTQWYNQCNVDWSRLNTFLSQIGHGAKCNSSITMSLCELKCCISWDAFKGWICPCTVAQYRGASKRNWTFVTDNNYTHDTTTDSSAAEWHAYFFPFCSS